MKTFTFKKKSWHYWLATITEPNVEYWKTRDLCSYIRRVIGGLLVVSLGLCLGLLLFMGIGLPVITAIVGDIMMLFHLPRLSEFWLTELKVGNGVLIVVSLVITLKYLWKRYCTSKRDLDDLTTEPTPDGFIKLAYKSFKDKVCYAVDFK